MIRQLMADGVPQRQVGGVWESGGRRWRMRWRWIAAAEVRAGADVVHRVRLTGAGAAGRASGMPATVIAERVGWTRSITWIGDKVQRPSS